MPCADDKDGLHGALNIPLRTSNFDSMLFCPRNLKCSMFKLPVSQYSYTNKPHNLPNII